uniref:Uncharacterized protein n=1 Tax=Globisporangium ultimum (strain ATCC 200006 / CBS 805.95 / DAOM BR144) TaxID=431595 RepID=K3X7D9_GLOUD
MSDVVPSFFPTPHEIAGGIRWMREHPVVATAAAAAATAVSVISYLKARAEDEQQLAYSADNSADEEEDEEDEDGDDYYEPNKRLGGVTATGNAHKNSDRFREHLRMATTSPRKEHADDIYSSTESEVSTTSPTVRGRNHNSYSVSNFAFAFEGCSVQDKNQDQDDSTHGPLHRNTTAALDKHASVIEEEDDEDTSTSPQWGWYVSTTPPDEHYT